MATLGLVGSGMIGSTVARLAVAAGYDVVLSNSRGPETLGGLVDELGAMARAASATDAASAGDLVVVSVPLKALPGLPVASLAGKVVIDTGNYNPVRDGRFAELDDGSLATSELAQRVLAGAVVVKCFNSIFFRHLGELSRKAGAPDRTALPIAGDDISAKATVAAFLDEIGYDAVDAGPLAESWRFEPGTPAYGAPYGGGARNFAAEPGSSFAADALRAVLAAARRDG